jgi:hypothetical protein
MVVAGEKEKRELCFAERKIKGDITTSKLCRARLRALLNVPKFGVTLKKVTKADCCGQGVGGASFVSSCTKDSCDLCPIGALGCKGHSCSSCEFSSATY